MKSVKRSKRFNSHDYSYKYVMVGGKELGRCGEEALAKEQSDNTQPSPEVHSGWSKRLRRDTP